MQTCTVVKRNYLDWHAEQSLHVYFAISYTWYLGNSTTTCVQATCSSTVTVWIGFMIKTWAKLPSILTVGFLPASERSIRPMSPSTMAKQTDSLVNLEILLTSTMDNAELSYLLEVRGLRNEVKIYLIAGCRFPEEKVYSCQF